MSDRHIFNDHTTLVARSLRGLVAAHPSLSLIPSLRVVYRAEHDRSKVSLICGGGSGHEPGTVGFVGAGLLTAAVAGDVFASPSAKQVMGGIKAVPSDEGVILIITNCECETACIAGERAWRGGWWRREEWRLRVTRHGTQADPPQTRATTSTSASPSSWPSRRGLRTSRSSWSATT